MLETFIYDMSAIVTISTIFIVTDLLFDENEKKLFSKFLLSNLIKRTYIRKYYYPIKISGRFFSRMYPGNISIITRSLITWLTSLIFWIFLLLSDCYTRFLQPHHSDLLPGAPCLKSTAHRHCTPLFLSCRWRESLWAGWFLTNRLPQKF